MEACPQCSAAIQTTAHQCPACGADVIIDGKYRLERRIGEGGMGEVWIARDLKLPRKIAIKFPQKKYLENSDVLARFDREANFMATVKHTNVVQVYTVGRWRDVPYIVMEMVDGRPLHMEADRPVPPAQILQIMTQLCAGLQCLHDKGVVHRDVKPDNIIVGADWRVTLVDLGIARDLAIDATHTDVSPGTPMYMAPEQLLHEAVDHRADIYAAGLVLYELLTGKQLSGEESRPLPRPPELEEPVWAVVQRALAKNREDRFSSAKEFASALKAALAEPALSSDVSPGAEPPRAQQSAPPPPAAPPAAEAPARSAAIPPTVIQPVVGKPDPTPPSKQMSSSDQCDKYDAFLCHNSSDKPQVRKLARRLEKQGLNVFLDEDSIPPGVRWMEPTQAAIRKSRAILILRGSSQVGPWAQLETEVALKESVRRGAAVIPVLLRGAPEPAPELPSFLELYHWVDLRHEDGFNRILAGIRNAPNPSPGTTCSCRTTATVTEA